MIKHIDDIQSLVIEHPTAANAMVKVLIGEEEGWEDYVMRVVELEEGGHTPKHKHDWIHVNFMLEGQGEIFMDGQAHPVKAGSFSVVESNVLHQYRNTGKEKFKFICIVKKEGHKV